MGVKSLSCTLLILSPIFIISANGDEAECIYGMYVQTGSIRRAGTHTKIGLTLSDEWGAQIEIPNLEDWGLMGLGFNYFETGELNIFGGKGPCLSGLKLISDGSGPYAGWYCEYVKVSSFGLEKPCSQQWSSGSLKTRSRMSLRPKLTYALEIVGQNDWASSEARFLFDQ